MQTTAMKRTAPDARLPAMGVGMTLATFGGAAVLMLLGTRVVIPALSARTGVEPVFFWFVVAGLGVFAPLLVIAWVLLRAEGALGRPGLWRDRLRFRRMSRGDWIWTVGAVVVIGALSAVAMAGVRAVAGAFDAQPPFVALEPLTPERYWLLAVWLPFWVLNLMGEEILWRGVMLPRQEVALGGGAWALHGAGWVLFHLTFGWQLLLTMLPILFVLPYVVQRRRNSWVGVVIHAGINGPGFLMVAFGLG